MGTYISPPQEIRDHLEHDLRDIPAKEEILWMMDKRDELEAEIKSKNNTIVHLLFESYCSLEQLERLIGICT